MVRLRDYFFSDLSTFFNAEEFAEEVNIEGKPMKVVIDNDLLEEYKLKNGGEGLDQIELLFHVEKSNFERKPSTNNIMRFNNKIYRIADVTEEEGMYMFKLTRNQA
jgi:hypothetical protein